MLVILEQKNCRQGRDAAMDHKLEVGDQTMYLICEAFLGFDKA
jgi:hypothetical protein